MRETENKGRIDKMTHTHTKITIKTHTRTAVIEECVAISENSENVRLCVSVVA